MNEEQAVVVKRDAPASLVTFGEGGKVAFSSLAAALEYGAVVVRSGFAPKGMDRPEAVAIAIQHGSELGLLPLQSLQSIAVINGRPGIYGDTALALVRATGLLEDYDQQYVGEGDARKCVVMTARKGAKRPMVHEFSVADAKRAGLWGKPGPWATNPDRMLLFRARGFALRDQFGDVLKGLAFVEELRDIPSERVVAGSSRVVSSEDLLTRKTKDKRAQDAAPAPADGATEPAASAGAPSEQCKPSDGATAAPSSAGAGDDVEAGARATALLNLAQEAGVSEPVLRSWLVEHKYLPNAEAALGEVDAKTLDLLIDTYRKRALLSLRKAANAADVL